MPIAYGKPIVAASKRLKVKKEFRLFRLGANKSSKGTYFLTPESAALLMGKYKERGLRCTFDYDHNSLKTGESARPGDGIGAGKCDLELRSDGIWCTNVQWTPKAEEEISQGAWCYFSPAFVAGDKQEILELINVALTNIPALDGIEPLAASRRSEATALNTNTEANVAHPISEHLKKFVSGGKSLADCAKASGVHADRCRELHDGGGAAPSQEEMKALGKALSLSGEQMKAMGVAEPYAGPSGEKETASAMDGQDVDDMEGEGDDDKDDVVKNTRGTEAVALLSFLTGESDPVKQRARAKAMAEEARMHREDHDTIVALKAERQKERLEALIKRGKDEGKLTPKNIKYFSTRKPDELEEYLKVAPVVLNTRSTQATESDGEDAVVQSLSREELEAARLFHMAPEDYAEAKKLAMKTASGGPREDALATLSRQRISLVSSYQKMADEEPKGIIAMKKGLSGAIRTS